MKNILPRNKEFKDVPTEVLISELKNAHAYRRTLIYNELSKRIDSEKELFNFLAEAISEKRNREEVFFGSIKVAWIPIINIFEIGNNEIVLNTKKTIHQYWEKHEIQKLKDYLEGEFNIENLL
jgi:hypothetical protein